MRKPNNDLPNQENNQDTELFMDGKQELYVHKGRIKEVDRTSGREAMEIGSDAKIGGNENQ